MVSYEGKWRDREQEINLLVLGQQNLGNREASGPQHWQSLTKRAHQSNRTSMWLGTGKQPPEPDGL
ncbi:MAG: hypothetical protein OEZ35_02290 [Candidatus Bathyarchaeota archaeon]|nr:hypothetical protein [Candidatus Bathyarchaeota archaeon]